MLDPNEPSSTLRSPLLVASVELLLDGIGRLALSQPLGSLTGVAIVAEGRHVDPELIDTLHVARARERTEIAEAFQTELGVDVSLAETPATVATAIANYAALCHRLGESDEGVERVVGSLAHILQLVDQQSPTASES